MSHPEELDVLSLSCESEEVVYGVQFRYRWTHAIREREVRTAHRRSDVALNSAEATSFAHREKIAVNTRLKTDT